MSDEIVNKVAQSALVTFDLEDYYQEGERVEIDIKDQLFQGIALKEKDFRAFVKDHDWSQYEHKLVAIHCSADAIIPTWAYMLLATRLEPYAQMVHLGTIKDLEVKLYADQLSAIDWESFQGEKVVIKGCSKYPVPDWAYVEATRKLRPYASSIMYGEPCSTVPLYKQKIKR